MMTYETLAALCAFAFVSSITPGPNNIMLMASGTNFGFRKTIPHIMGVNLGFAVLALCVGFGLIQVFNTFPITQIALKFFCTVYLVFLAYKIATAAPAVKDKGSTASPMSFFQAALFQWVNPKVWTMALTAISLYSSPNAIISVLSVTCVFTVINLPCICFWALLGQQFQKVIVNNLGMRTFNVSMAILLLGTLFQVHMLD